MKKQEWVYLFFIIFAVIYTLVGIFFVIGITHPIYNIFQAILGLALIIGVIIDWKEWRS
jgi:uncharacterized membrane protein